MAKNTQHSKSYIWLVPFIIGIIASSFYAYDFLVRVMPMAMAHDLLSAFKIQASELSILFSGFFYGYALMQIPGGMMCDKFGARRLLSFGLFICAMATAVFGFTRCFPIAVIARIIMGLTASISYLGALWVGAYWLGSQRFALYASLVQVLGCTGAIIGSAPVAHLTTSYGWQNTSYLIALLGFLLAILNWFVIQDKSKKKSNLKSIQEKKFIPKEDKFYLRDVFKSSQSWWIALFGFAIWGPVVLFATSWGALFLTSSHHFSNVFATGLLSLIWIGITIGGPIFGWWTNFIKRRRLPIITAALLGFISACLILYVPALPKIALSICLLLFGAASSSQAIAFGLVIDNNQPQALGTASGLTNMGIIFAGVALQPFVGLLLDKLWDGQMVNSAPVYSIHAYQIALTMIPFLFFLAFIISGFIVKETYCKKQYH
ncbi:MFS transporter [Coxiella endosymbiont of Dermacentor marginatus]|uniref:MFS transporter n=1 Tax=Coxiella endosymbiont of Dermacentor marginatus TaxID=1656159 RepID=UPI002223E731|nr:MFS transporter [Coxiella endosymbiont of Dermacentor marginatus]